MTRACVFCDKVKEGMRFAVHATCFDCTDALIEQALSVRLASRQKAIQQRGGSDES